MEPFEKRIKLFCQFHRASATAKFNNNLFTISVMHTNNISILHGYRTAFDRVYLQQRAYDDHPEQGGQPVTAGTKLTGRTELWLFACSFSEPRSQQLRPCAFQWQGHSSKMNLKGWGRNRSYFPLICLASKKGEEFAVHAMKVQGGVEV